MNSRACKGINLSERQKLVYKTLIGDRSKVDGPTGCWLWTRALGTKGYGQVTEPRLAKSPIRAHRLAYAVYNGNPGELVVRHTCDTPACVNPEHLLLGTVADNNRDRVSRGRRCGPKLMDIKPTILRMLTDLGYTQTRIAAMFGVSQSTISNRILRRFR